MKTQISQEEFNKTVANNLVAYRKHNNITQLALAEKLNYSDKAVSKWEHGESIPDAYVLSQIANLYGVTVNDLITPSKKPKTSLKKISVIFIPLLSVCIAWIVATVVYFAWRSAIPNGSEHWLSFIVAVPVTFIITLVFACVYKSLIIQFISVSGLVWTTVMALHLSLRNFFPLIDNLYFVAIPLQILATLWYAYRGVIKKKNNQKNVRN